MKDKQPTPSSLIEFLSSQEQYRQVIQRYYESKQIGIPSIPFGQLAVDYGVCTPEERSFSKRKLDIVCFQVLKELINSTDPTNLSPHQIGALEYLDWSISHPL